MAIGPQQVRESVRQDIIDDTEQKIDAKLADPRWLADWVTNAGVNPTFKIVLVGNLTIQEKKLIVSKYKDAGWGDVIVTNSGENGERAGLFGVDFYTYKL